MVETRVYFEKKSKENFLENYPGLLFTSVFIYDGGS